MQLYTFVKAHWTVHLKLVNFIVWELNFTKADFKKLKPSFSPSITSLSFLFSLSLWEITIKFDGSPSDYFLTHVHTQNRTCLSPTEFVSEGAWTSQFLGAPKSTS